MAINPIFFTGAGAFAPFGIPIMCEMAEKLEANLKESIPYYLRLFDYIKSKLRDYEHFNIEALITVLQDIIGIDNMCQKVFNHPSIHYFSDWSLSFEKMAEINKDDAKRNRSDAEELLKHINFNQPVPVSCALYCNGGGWWESLEKRAKSLPVMLYSFSWSYLTRFINLRYTT